MGAHSFREDYCAGVGDLSEIPAFRCVCFLGALGWGDRDIQASDVAVVIPGIHGFHDFRAIHGFYSLRGIHGYQGFHEIHGFH